MSLSSTFDLFFEHGRPAQKSQAFVDTLHGTFLISAIVLLAAALLVAFLLKQPANKMSVKSVGLREVTEAFATQGVGEKKVTG